MRVLLVANFQIEYTIQLANALSRSLDVTLALWDQLAPELGRLVDPRVFVVPLRSPGRFVGSKLASQLAVASLSRKLRPDVVHFQNAYAWGTPLIPIVAAGKWVVTVHDPLPHEGSPDVLSFPALAAQIPRSDGFVVMGAAQRRSFLSRFRVDPARVWVIPHGEFSFLRRYGLVPDPDSHTVLFFGRLSPYKGIDILLQAAAILRHVSPEIRFRIVGAGDLSRYSEQISGLTNLQVVNRFLSIGEIAEEIGRASLVVAPYNEASQSGVVIAAQSLGRPVIATRVGGMVEDVKDGETGLLVQPRDPGQLADAIRSLVGNQRTLATMGRKAEEFMLTERNWGAIAEKTIRLYEGVP